MSLSPASFDYIRAALRLRSAHHLEDDKAYLVETRLLALARRHGFRSVEELVVRLRTRPNERVLDEIVEAMTINETFFFRDGHPFEALRRTVLPELVRLRSGERRLAVWSAACSSGQEIYSVAMLLREGFPELDGWDVRLIGSDISAAVLDRARRGQYSALEVSRGLSPELLAKYFERAGDDWRIADDLRRRVEFLAINLSGPWPELPPFDVVLLRNVLIYFDAPTRERILGKVRRALRPDGCLVLGGAETASVADSGFEPVPFEQVTLFRPRPVGPSGPAIS
jgi:chemotaxis protein methyltransferase CheR